MFYYRGLGYLGVMIPVLSVLALDYGLKFLGVDWHSAAYRLPLWWMFGVTFIITGIAVFLLGRHVNGVSGPLNASYGRNTPPARHSLNGWALEKAGPVSIVIGLGILTYYVISVLR